MKRFYGMMPHNEIKIEKLFRVGQDQLLITIQAGENGYSILYADNSSEFKDVEDTSENNFNKAFNIIKNQFKNINPVK